MNGKQVYKFRIKHGAHKEMAAILKYPDTSLSIVDGSICCITDVITANKKYLKDEKLLTSIELLYQIKMNGFNAEHEAFILPELLEELPFDDWVF